MTDLPEVVICDDDATLQLALKHALKGKYSCRTARAGDEAVAIVKNHPVDAVLLDVQMSTPDEGIKTIPRLRNEDPELAIIMLSGVTDFHTVREAMRLGATDFVPKDAAPEEITLAVDRALDRRRLVKRSAQQNFEAREYQRRHVMIGESQPIIALVRTLERLRGSRANVVITGETGAGKEVAARLLRRTLEDGTLEPFVAVDSSTIQGARAESQLFGHEKGAFTGADRANKGLFEEADGGIIYFDEIGNMPLEIQVKLLRVLQEKEVTRMGSTRPLPLEFRVVCATNRDLEKMSQDGSFKHDLLQRLNVLPVELPPLRDRREDLPLLVRHFLAKQARPELSLTTEAVAALQAYAWPGNVRELSNLVAYVAAMSDGPEINVSDLPPKLRDASTQAARAQAAQTQGGTFYDRVADFERELLKREYETQKGNVTRLALALGMDRSHLHAKLKEYGIHQARQS